MQFPHALRTEQDITDLIAAHRTVFGDTRMEDPPADPPADPPPATDPPADPPADPPKDDTDWKAEARKWEDRAKANKDAATKLAEIEKANQSEAERLATERDAERDKATAAISRAVRSEVKALADTFRVRDDAVLHLKERGDLTRFVDDTGDIDIKAISKELEAVLKDRPDLAAEQPAPPNQPNRRPVEQLRPAADPSNPQRSTSLAAAVTNHYQN